MRVPATVWAIVAVLSAPSAVANELADYEDRIARFRAFAGKQMAMDELVGITVGFVHEDVMWAEGFGYADLENELPAHERSAYRLASVTKPMTAMGVLMLVEDGKVDLDAEVQTYVPYFPAKDYPVTVRLVLGHLGGISHYQDYDVEGHFKYHKNTREAIEVFADFDLVAEPGTRYNYSSYGYNLLGAVIEGASGQPYGEFMRERLWGPFGMDDTRMDDPHDLIPHRVRGYRKGRGGRIENSEFVDISSRFAAGGTRSTVPDLLRFARGVMHEEALSPRTMDLMWTPMVERHGEATGYGMGWTISDVNGRFRAAHSGGQAETSTYLAIFPRDHFAIAVACNLEGGDRFPYLDHLLRAILGEAWGQWIYVADAADEEAFKAALYAFDEGVMYWDRYQRPVTSDPAALEAALDLFNTQCREAYPDSMLGLDRPYESNPLVILGSYMATSLASARGAEFGQEVHRRGVAAFFADYVAAYRGGDIPDGLRFTAPFEERVATWASDWEQVWTDDLLYLSVAQADDLDGLSADLRGRFQGLSIYPDYIRELTGLARARFQNGDLDGALSVSANATAVYPRAAGPRVLEGVCLLATGNPEGGRDQIVRAHELDPDGGAGASALNNLAYELKEGGQTGLGLQVLEIALALHPDVANLYDSTGEFHLDLGDRELAIEYYEKAAAMDPEFENPRRMLERIRSEVVEVGM